jgi:DNA-binding PadR family transcriptional regulator
MESLSRYLETGSCAEFDWIKTAIILTIHVGGRASAQDILERIEADKRFNPQHAKIDTRTVQYVLLMLQKYGYVTNDTHSIYTIAPRHREKIAELARSFTASENINRSPVVNIDEIVKRCAVQGIPSADPAVMTQSIFITQDHNGASTKNNPLSMTTPSMTTPLLPKHKDPSRSNCAIL